MTKLLVVGDAGANTGFERVVRGVADYLHGTGRYDITVRGIGYTPRTSVRTYPYTVKSWGGESDDPLGVTKFPKWLREDTPDAVLLVQDLWNITNYLAYKPRELPAVAYFPVDTPNLKPIYCMGLGAVSEAVSYTRFGAMEAAAGVRKITDAIFEAGKTGDADQLTWATLPKDGMQLHVRFDRFARYQNPDAWHVVPHGMERGIFEPRDQQEARAKFGLPTDAFIVSNINTNQFRKRQDLTLRAFKLLVDRNPNAFLVLHCAGGDRDGWDLFDLVHYLEIPTDRVACVHYSKPSLTDDELCWLYNTADVQINTAGGEGWGLTAFEGAACGVPQVVPDWSATRELWQDHGLLTPVANYRVEPKRINTVHAEIDVEALAKQLYQLSQTPALRTTYSERALALAAAQPSWDDVGARFDAIITKALAEPVMAPMTRADIVDRRVAGVRSEFAGRATMASYCAVEET